MLAGGDLSGESFFGGIGFDWDYVWDSDWSEIRGAVTGYAYEDSGGSIRAGEIPEPSPLALLAMGATGVAAMRRRKNKKTSAAHAPA